MNRKLLLVGAFGALGCLLGTPQASAAFKYFDADIIGYTLAGSKAAPETAVAPNTTLVNGSPVTYTLDGGSGGTGVDNLWRVRTNNGFGNRATNSIVVAGGPKPAADAGSGLQVTGDIIEARGDFGANNSEDVPTLKTTIAVPAVDQGQERAVYAFFWTAGTARWQIGASLTNSNDGVATQANPLQPVFVAGNPGRAISGVFDPTLPSENPSLTNTTHLFNVFDLSTQSGSPPAAAVVVNPLYATDNSLLTTTDGANSGGPAGDRQLWAAFLGNVTLGTSLSVFIGESVAGTQALSGGNNRTWYDGIGYGDPVSGLAPLLDVYPIPEPTGAVLAALGVTLLVSRRR